MLKKYDIVKEIYRDGSLSNELYIVHNIAPNGYANIHSLNGTLNAGFPDGDTYLHYVRDGTKEELISAVKDDIMPLSYYLGDDFEDIEDFENIDNFDYGDYVLNVALQVTDPCTGNVTTKTPIIKDVRAPELSDGLRSVFQELIIEDRQNK